MFRCNSLWLGPLLKGLIFYSLLPGCVGPTSPFGAVENLSSKDEAPLRSISSTEEFASAEILFHPQKQVLHDRTDFTIEVRDQAFIADDYQLKVFHNRYDVTEKFLNQSQLFKSNNGKQLLFTLKNFRLKTLDQNNIEVQFTKKNGQQVAASFDPPQCSLFQRTKLKKMGRFTASVNYIPMIEKVALSSDYNPSFLAGIVAQESGFNPKAVSWAKAIGLTQVTPLAEQEVIDQFDEWPRHPGINSLSYITLKSKIISGEIDDKTEWRLDPQKSLEGGSAYINYLRAYWSRDNNKKVVESLDGDFQVNMTEVILASYNSGAARVKAAIQKRKQDWKKQKNLKEAVKYIKKVTSYCFHYSEKEREDDKET